MNPSCPSHARILASKRRTKYLRRGISQKPVIDRHEWKRLVNEAAKIIHAIYAPAIAQACERTCTLLQSVKKAASRYDTSL